MNKNFIKATEECCSFEKHIPAPCLRKSFTLDFESESANLSICGLGFYRLFINGCEITKGQLAPYISNPDHCCYYDDYDIKGLLNKGENVIGVILGNGFYNQFGGAVWDFEKAPWLGSPRLALEFRASAGEKELSFIADTSFKVHASPIIFDDLRMGEYYDANKELKGWAEPGFDDSDWKNALTAETPRGEIKLCEADPITILRTIKPVRITKFKNGYIYDFGVNTAGVCRLKIKGEKGQKITLRHGEMLTADGELDQRSVGFDRPTCQYYKEYNQKDVFISDGEEREFIPRFTYHGFRYVEVSGINENQATEELLEYLEMSSGFKTLASFECSDEIVNKLYEMTVRSDRSNFFYFPTDCPHREKNGWMGDASMSADHMALMYDVGKSWRVWLDNIRKAQTERGELPGIVPTDTWGIEWGNGPAWDSALFNLSYMLFKYRADKNVIKENASAMVRYLEYILSRRNADGTVGIGLGDWVPVNRNANDYDTPIELSDSIMVMDMAKKAAEMFTVIGYKHHAEFADGIYKDMRAAIRRELINTKTGLAAGNCQSSQAMCIYYGVFEECEKQSAFDRLLEFIHAKGDSFDCGFIGMHTIFHVLSSFGYGELAYHMITKKEFPSYGYWVETGETTLLEHFRNNVNTNLFSHNHHFLGDIGRWFINRIAGLTVLDSEHIEITPDFIKSIDNASASVELPKGKASVSWKRDGDMINLNINVCKGVKYKISLPENVKVTITEG